MSYCLIKVHCAGETFTPSQPITRGPYDHKYTILGLSTKLRVHRSVYYLVNAALECELSQESNKFQ